MRPPQRPWWRALARTALTGGIALGATALSLGATTRADALPTSAAITSSTAPATESTGATPARWPVIAHRGGTVWGPEHTHATFERALARGVDGVEIDVRFTRDGVPVLMHDHTVDRTTACAGLVSAMTAQRLVNCDAGSWFGAAFAGQRPLTLRDTLSVIGAAPGRTALLHVKTCRRGEPAAIVDALTRSGMADRATLLSNSPVCLARLAAAGAPALGYAVNNPAEFARGVRAGYEVLVTYNLPLDAAMLILARSGGSRVLAVAGHPHSLAELALLPLDAVIADDAEAAMRATGR